MVWSMSGEPGVQPPGIDAGSTPRQRGAGGASAGAPRSPGLEPQTPVQYLRGIGPVRAGALARLGVRTVADLLGYLPFRYEFQEGHRDIAQLRPGMTATVVAGVVRVSRYRGMLRCEVSDGTAALGLRFFHEPYRAADLHVGALLEVTGRAEDHGGRLEMVHPRIRPLPAETDVGRLRRRGPGLVPVYRAGGQVSSQAIHQAVLQVLRQPVLPVEEFVPPELLRRRDLLTHAKAVREIHAPSDARERERARRTLAYEELLLLELGMALRRLRAASVERGPVLRCTPEIDRRIRARFPFELTGAQNQAVAEIVRDLGSGRPMTRLVQGDVGSGKTVVALYACLVAVANRRQAAIMAPTELLARQHLAGIERYLAGSRVRHLLLHGGMMVRERAAALHAIRGGQVDLVVGTQALIQQDVTFSDLALVVVDEQHKFGVLQRHRFRTKGPMPHYLVMTATPIPRTLALTVFGDLDVSVIRELPPGRGRVVTRVVTPAMRAGVLDFVRGRLEAGQQAYVVCPSIGGAESQAADGASPEAGRQAAARWPAGVSEGMAGAGCSPAPQRLTSARQVYAELVSGPWRGLEVGLLHGSLPGDEKERILRRFAAGQLHALVCTTVVEVGLDVPQATIMLVEQAERYGLSQLHQLRGRVGRSSRGGLCVLLLGAADARARQRVGVLAQTTDGFRIAEADLAQRGPGELLGTRQHGLPELRVADLVGDFELLEQARSDAFEIVRRDPRLERPEHRQLAGALRRFFRGRLALIDAA